MKWQIPAWWYMWLTLPSVVIKRYSFEQWTLKWYSVGRDGSSDPAKRRAFCYLPAHMPHWDRSRHMLCISFMPWQVVTLCQPLLGMVRSQHGQPGMLCQSSLMHLLLWQMHPQASRRLPSMISRGLWSCSMTGQAVPQNWCQQSAKEALSQEELGSTHPTHTCSLGAAHEMRSLPRWSIWGQAMNPRPDLPPPTAWGCM